MKSKKLDVMGVLAVIFFVSSLEVQAIDKKKLALGLGLGVGAAVLGAGGLGYVAYRNDQKLAEEQAPRAVIIEGQRSALEKFAADKQQKVMSSTVVGEQIAGGKQPTDRTAAIIKDQQERLDRFSAVKRQQEAAMPMSPAEIAARKNLAGMRGVLSDVAQYEQSLEPKKSSAPIKGQDLFGRGAESPESQRGRGTGRGFLSPVESPESPRAGSLSSIYGL